MEFLLGLFYHLSLVSPQSQAPKQSSLQCPQVGLVWFGVDSVPLWNANLLSGGFILFLFPRKPSDQAQKQVRSLKIGLSVTRMEWDASYSYGGGLAIILESFLVAPHPRMGYAPATDLELFLHRFQIIANC